MKKYTNKEYDRLVTKESPKSPIVKNCILAFLVGGAICTVGQVIKRMLTDMGLSEETVSSSLSTIMIFLGALFTGLGWYDKLAKYAGAGTIVPITGFANSIVSPAMEFKKEGYVMGVGAKLFTIAGPVLVFGISASVLAGLIYFVMR